VRDNSSSAFFAELEVAVSEAVSPLRSTVSAAVQRSRGAPEPEHYGSGQSGVLNSDGQVIADGLSTVEALHFVHTHGIARGALVPADEALTALGYDQQLFRRWRDKWGNDTEHATFMKSVFGHEFCTSFSPDEIVYGPDSNVKEFQIPTASLQGLVALYVNQDGPRAYGTPLSLDDFPGAHAVLVTLNLPGLIDPSRLDSNGNPPPAIRNLNFGPDMADLINEHQPSDWLSAADLASARQAYADRLAKLPELVEPLVK
jgi:hypothetical protein